MTLAKIGFVLLAIVFSTLNLSPRAEASGNEGPHGGDIYALEFTTLGRTLAQSLVEYKISHDALFTQWHFTPAQFNGAVSAVRVVSDEGDQVILAGHEVDAINTPEETKILINRTRWRESSLKARVELVLHEYFGILGVERDHFDASIAFSEFTQIVSRQISAQASSNTFMANLFYGRCVSIPPLSDTSICSPGTEKFAQAVSCAQALADGKCKLAGQSKCDLASTDFTAKVSVNPIGLRYCEILTIVK